MSEIVTIAGQVRAIQLDESGKTGALTINDHSISIEESTIVHGSVKLGALAKVKAKLVADKLVAIEVEGAAEVDSPANETIKFQGIVRQVERKRARSPYRRSDWKRPWRRYTRHQDFRSDRRRRTGQGRGHSRQRYADYRRHRRPPCTGSSRYHHR